MVRAEVEDPLAYTSLDATAPSRAARPSRGAAGPAPRRLCAGGTPRARHADRAAGQRRLVRGTWLLVALPLLLAAFTVGAAAAAAAAGAAADLRRWRRPPRSPGSWRATTPTARPARAGALGAASGSASQLRALRLRDRDRHASRRRVPGHGTVELRNLVAVVPGPSRRSDRRSSRTATTPARAAATNDNASGTAALDRARAGVRAGRRRVGRARRVRPTRSSSSRPTAAPTARSAPPASRHVARTATDVVAVVSLDAIGGPRAPAPPDRRRHARSPRPTLVRTAADAHPRGDREPSRADRARSTSCSTSASRSRSASRARSSPGACRRSR